MSAPGGALGAAPWGAGLGSGDPGGGTSYTFGSGLTLTGTTVTNNVLTGVSGGQTWTSGTGAADPLTITTTSHGTKGKATIAGALTVDQANLRAGINASSPELPFQVGQWFGSGNRPQPNFGNVFALTASVGLNPDPTQGGQIWLIDNSTLGADKGGGMTFAAVHTAGAQASLGGFQWRRQNGTDSNLASYAVFYTRPAAADCVEAFRILSDQTLDLRVPASTGDQDKVRLQPNFGMRASFFWEDDQGNDCARVSGHSVQGEGTFSNGMLSFDATVSRFATLAGAAVGFEVRDRSGSTPMLSIGASAITGGGAKSGGGQLVLVTGCADTGVTQELADVYLNLSRTVTFSTAPASQRAVRIAAPTYAGTGTIADAATLYIDGAPAQGAGITLTRKYPLWIDSGVMRYDGQIANGGGAAPTLGTVGGSGPTTAAQSGWIEINIDGNRRFIPVWA